MGRATEGLSCFNLECDPTTAAGRARLLHIAVEEALALRKMGLEARKKLRAEQGQCNLDEAGRFVTPELKSGKKNNKK